MQYAPIVIPTLNRFDKLKKCLDSLQNNTHADESDVFIFVDYPPSEKYVLGYHKIKDYLTTEQFAFKSLNVVYRDHNFGANQNILEAYKEVFDQYDRLIVSEDDNVFAPNFLDYMNKCLDKFNDNNHVLGICGYSYPIEWEDDNATIVTPQSFFSCWGFGIWRQKEKTLRESLNVKSFRDMLNDKKFISNLRRNTPKNYCYLLIQCLKNHSELTDIVRSLYMLKTNCFCIMPKTSLVKNTGWDGSGIHGASFIDSNEGYDKQEISNNKNYDVLLPSKLDRNDVNEKKLNELYAPSKKLLWACNLIYRIILILGINRFFCWYDQHEGYKLMKKIANKII